MSVSKIEETKEYMIARYKHDKHLRILRERKYNPPRMRGVPKIEETEEYMIARYKHDKRLRTIRQRKRYALQSLECNKIQCPCSGRYIKSHKKTHSKTLKHQAYLEEVKKANKPQTIKIKIKIIE